MSGTRKRVAGVELDVIDGWFDITHELPEGSPVTLARGAEGIGVLQLSAALHKAGKDPQIISGDLRQLLIELGKAHLLGAPQNISDEDIGGMTIVGGDFRLGAEFIRAWYLSDGRNVVHASYVTMTATDAACESESVEAEAMARSIRW